MATTNFYLKEANKKGECRVVMVYQRKGFLLTHNTGLKIKPALWTDKQRAKFPKEDIKAENEFNAILEGLQGNIKEIERFELLQRRKLSPDAFKRCFLEKEGKVLAVDDFFSAFDKLIETSKTTKSLGTIKHYKTTRGKLLKFEGETGNKVSFETIDNRFYERFIDFLINQEGHLNNTVGLHIKILKAVYNYAVKNELAKDNKAVGSFKVFKEDVECIYLTDDELNKLLDLKDLPAHLEDTRDNFCFACFTGLRYSDIAKLNNSHVKEGYLEIRTEKTKDILQIPLSNGAKEILLKHGGRLPGRPLPNCISNQKANDNLKIICKMAGIDEFVELEKYKGAVKLRILKHKHDLISMHTARRTFITLSLEKGVRPEVVMEITGHKDYGTFKKYVKITSKVKIIELTRAWNKPTLQAV